MKIFSQIGTYSAAGVNDSFSPCFSGGIKGGLAVCLLLILSNVSPVKAQSSSTADSLFRVGQAAYEDGDFTGAELAALRGLREAEGLDDLAKLKFHALLGFVYVARDQNEVAKTEFLKALSANPAYELDPVTTSPKILEVFRAARAEYMLRVASEPAIYRMPQADVRISASWRSLVLPGWGQFYKQQEVKGSAIAAAQVLSLAALIYMEFEVHRRHEDYLNIKDYNNPAVEDRYQSYRHAYQTRNAVGYITFGIYLVNYFDALYAPVRRK